MSTLRTSSEYIMEEVVPEGWHIRSPAHSSSFVASHMAHSLTYSNLREVVVIPNEKWGGSGLLGCGVG